MSKILSLLGIPPKSNGYLKTTHANVTTGGSVYSSLFLKSVNKAIKKVYNVERRR